MGIKEELESIIVRNPNIALRDGEVCFYSVKAQYGTPSLETTTTVKPGLGIGVVLPVTKHLGLGIGKRKVKTTTKTKTVWNKEPCEFYVLSSRFVLKLRNNTLNLDLERINDLKVNKDALTIQYGGQDIYLFMLKADVKRFMDMYELLGRARQSGMDLTPYGGSPTEESRQNNITSRSEQPEVSVEYERAVLLWFAGRKATPILKRDEYPSYLYYECGTQNAPAYHRSLIKDGYLREAKLEELLDTLKVDQLKSILKSNGSSTTGKKANLVARIVEEVPQDKVTGLFPQKKYVLSDTGNEFLEVYKDCVDLHIHSNWQISEAEFDSEKEKDPDKTFYEVCWRILADRVKNTENCSEQRNIYYNMYQIVKNAGNDRVALSMLLRVLYLDLSGSCNTYYESYKNKWLSKKEFLERINADILFAPALIKDIGDLEEYYREDMLTPLYSLELPVKLCPDDLFEDIVNSIFIGNFDKEFYAQRLADAYRRYI